jgi:hypothetical protein
VVDFVETYENEKETGIRFQEPVNADLLINAIEKLDE